MAEVQPFKAIHYNTDVVRNLSKVVAPPYDVINKEQQKELFDRDPNNIIKLDLNPAADPYPEAAYDLIKLWLAGKKANGERVRREEGAFVSMIEIEEDALLS